LKSFVKPVIKVLASGFFAGYIPRGGGTVASLLACAIWIILSSMTRHNLVVPLLVTALGFSIAGYAERKVFFEHDSPKIVIDEISGMLVTYMGFSFSRDVQGLVFGAAGFLLFRIFDIFKPVPVGLTQRVKGGPGIMLDDLVSGALANGLLWLIGISFFR
jgi:phosphatidylglycerophosphatase A